MNKNAIQKYAIWARNELIEQVKQRAYQYGISDEGYGDENASVIAGRVLSADEKRQRAAFVSEIKENGFEQAVEEVAYTWFNRFVALRFMEVNDYLPTHVRVFSDASGGFNPEILKDVLHLELEDLDKSKVSEMLNANQTEELYRYLLLTQCNALNDALPEMFEKLGTYTEMLLPNNILKQDSILARLVKDIDEDDWKDAVQIIGWMYQYYNTEPKSAVFARPSTTKIKREEVPAATQIFTPDWIVRYMVENSLGRLWLESHPNDALKANWKYYLDEAEQTPEVAEKLRIMRSQSPVKSPEDIRLIDPCMGSGHILVYAFDVLMQIYESEGYNPRDAAKLILEKNIYGLDIDCRAYQLSYFSLMMKARQYNRRIFTDGVMPQVYQPAGFADGEEYGSLVKVDILEPMPELSKEQQLTLFDSSYDEKLNAWNYKRLLAQKYDVVVTNPPYAVASGLNEKLSNFLKFKYPNSKSDMFAAFIERCLAFVKHTGLVAMITQQAWISLPSYEKLRGSILEENTIINMIHLGNGSFGIADYGLASFVIGKAIVVNYQGLYVRLVDNDNPDWKEKTFLSKKHRHIVESSRFSAIPGTPISAYWIGQKAVKKYTDNPLLKEFAETKQGFKTGKNEKFLRLWHEVDLSDCSFNGYSAIKKWFPCTKGGSFRKWYGNHDYVVNWFDEGREIRNYRDKDGKQLSRPQNLQFNFCEGLSWSVTTSGSFSMRFSPRFMMYESKGPGCFSKNKDTLQYILSFYNSCVFELYISALAPTVEYSEGALLKIPFIYDQSKTELISELTTVNIFLTTTEWDSFETSWDFKKHPLIFSNSVESAFQKWEWECIEKFSTLKANEEELNRIFIEIYGLQDELTPEVEDKDVTVRLANKEREIRSLISYAVGCIFGRYSLDTEGIAYAGGDWDVGKYTSFTPDRDNIIPICDDEYFDDDIVGLFVNFVRTVYGADTLEENLKFIADALGGFGTSREVIRNYFLNKFFADHCSTYSVTGSGKRPIYWLFDSGKKNGFKALIYMHRYSSDLLARLRTDYVHEQQERYRTQLSHINSDLSTATGSKRTELLNNQKKLSEQLKEINNFEEKVHHLADQNIEIDLDDGVKKNYEIFSDVLSKI